MHEASLMRDLMRKVDEIARAEGAARVVKVDVWLGALSHMSAAHFREHFAQCAGNTIAEGASLDIAVSDDVNDANAQSIMLRGIDVER
jgi:hydrogenase nickel incorporation protein HypA/HybF